MKRAEPAEVGQRHPSPPTRGRGLKPGFGGGAASVPVSPPTRGRGLKRTPLWMLPASSGRPPRGGAG